MIKVEVWCTLEASTADLYNKYDSDVPSSELKHAAQRFHPGIDSRSSAIQDLHVVKMCGHAIAIAKQIAIA